MQKIRFFIIAFFIFFSNALFAQHLNKDGTTYRRYKENKSYSTPSNYNGSTIHLKKDGTLMVFSSILKHTCFKYPDDYSKIEAAVSIQQGVDPKDLDIFFMQNEYFKPKPR